LFEEMQNGAIWGHFKVSYNIESSTILMTLIDKNFLQLSKILSSLGLMHILTEILKWTCTKQWRCSYLLRHEGQILDNFKKFLSIKVIKIVLDSMLYETLKWPQIAPFCISSKKNPRPPPPLKNYVVHTIKPQLRPW
jgi:hypothetical protein